MFRKCKLCLRTIQYRLRLLGKLKTSISLHLVRMEEIVKDKNVSFHLRNLWNMCTSQRLTLFNNSFDFQTIWYILNNYCHYTQLKIFSLYSTGKNKPNFKQSIQSKTVLSIQPFKQSSRFLYFNTSVRESGLKVP